MARVRAPDHEVAGLHGAARDVPAVLQHCAGVGAGPLAAVRVDRRPRPLVTEGREPRAVGVQRELARMVDPIDRSQLLVMDLALVLDPPARDLDDLRAEAGLPRGVLQALLAPRLERRWKRVPAQEAGELRAEDFVAGLRRIAERPLRRLRRGGARGPVLAVDR